MSTMMEETQFSDEVKIRVDDREEQIFGTSVIRDVMTRDSTYWHGGDRINDPSPPPSEGRQTSPSDGCQHTDSPSSSDDNIGNSLLRQQAKPLMTSRDGARLNEALLSHPFYRKKRHISLGVCVSVAFLAGFTLCVVYFLRFFLGVKKIPPHPEIVGCSNIEVEDVWVVGIPKLLTESAFRLLDINDDGVLDPIFGFATGRSSSCLSLSGKSDNNVEFERIT